MTEILDNAEYLKHYKIITHLEALNLIHAVTLLMPDDPLNYDIVVNTDNMNSQQILSHGSGKDRILCACACRDKNLNQISSKHTTKILTGEL